jgi:hypothetical protein
MNARRAALVLTVSLLVPGLASARRPRAASRRRRRHQGAPTGALRWAVAGGTPAC